MRHERPSPSRASRCDGVRGDFRAAVPRSHAGSNGRAAALVARESRPSGLPEMGMFRLGCAVREPMKRRGGLGLQAAQAEPMMDRTKGVPDGRRLAFLLVAASVACQRVAKPYPVATRSRAHRRTDYHASRTSAGSPPVRPRRTLPPGGPPVLHAWVGESRPGSPQTSRRPSPIYSRGAGRRGGEHAHFRTSTPIPEGMGSNSAFTEPVELTARWSITWSGQQNKRHHIKSGFDGSVVFNAVHVPSRAALETSSTPSSRATRLHDRTTSFRGLRSTRRGRADPTSATARPRRRDLFLDARHCDPTR